MMATTKIYIDDFAIGNGETKKVAVKLDTDEKDINIIKFKLQLPQGLDFVQEGKDIRAEQVTERTEGMLLQTSYDKHNVLLSSIDGVTAVTPGDGPILYVYVKENGLANGKIVIENASAELNGGGSVEDVKTQGAEVSKSDATVNGVSVKFTENEVTLEPGETKSLNVALDNPADVVQGFQATLSLPNNFTATVEGLRGAAQYKAETGRIVIDNKLTGYSGNVLKIDITASETFAGSAQVKLSDIIAVVNNQRVELGSINTTVVSTKEAEKPSVAFSADSVTQINETVIYPGKSQDIAVLLTNHSAEVNGFQAILELPKGWAVTPTGNKDRGTISWNANTSKIIFVGKGLSISGEEGVLFTLPLTAPKDFEGEAEITLKNIILTVNYDRAELSDLTLTVKAQDTEKEEALAALKEEIENANKMLEGSEEEVEVEKALADAIAAAQEVIDAADEDITEVALEDITDATEALKKAEEAYAESIEDAAKAAAEEKAAELQEAVDKLAVSDETKASEDEDVKAAVEAAEEAIKAAQEAVDAVNGVIAEGDLATENAEALAEAIAAAEEAIEDAQNAIKAAEEAYAKTVGINSVKIDKEGKAVYYDLNGQRIATLKKGQAVIVVKEDGSHKKLIIK